MVGAGATAPEGDGVDMPGLELLMLRDQALPVDSGSTEQQHTRLAMTNPVQGLHRVALLPSC